MTARTASPLAGELLLHPASLAAVVALVFNDHVGKRLWPSVVTGKLSDVAGLFVFPVLLASLCELADEWRGTGIDRTSSASTVRFVLLAAVTGVAFAAIKTWSPATSLYATSMSALQYPARLAWALTGGAPSPSLEHVSVARDATDLFCIPAALLAPFVVQRNQACPTDAPTYR